jgi:hypothetical protein
MVSLWFCRTVRNPDPRSASRRSAGQIKGALSGRILIRPISDMHRKEIEHYEKETAKVPKR